jgi:hypothetical protein
VRHEVVHNTNIVPFDHDVEERESGRARRYLVAAASEENQNVYMY